MIDLQGFFELVSQVLALFGLGESGGGSFLGSFLGLLLGIFGF